MQNRVSARKVDATVDTAVVEVSEVEALSWHHRVPARCLSGLQLYQNSTKFHLDQGSDGSMTGTRVELPAFTHSLTQNHLDSKNQITN